MEAQEGEPVRGVRDGLKLICRPTEGLSTVRSYILSAKLTLKVNIVYPDTEYYKIISD